LAFIIIRIFVFAPYADATEFAYAAWLIAHGKILYADFFQNHSPWYILLIYSIFNTNSVFFVLKLSLFHASAALFGAGVFSRIIWLEAASDEPSVRRRSALVAFLLFLTLYRACSIQAVRPETLCVVTLLTAVLCGKGIQSAGRIASWMRAIGFGLCIGLSVCLTPRAALLATAAVAWIAWQNRGSRSWVQIAVALAVSAALLLTIITPFVSLQDVYRWVIVFNGQLPISHDIGKFTIAPGTRYSVPVFIMTSIIIVTRTAMVFFRRKLNDNQRYFVIFHDIHKDFRFIYIEICILLSLIFLYFDRIWAIYSFDFVALLDLSWLSLAGIHASRRLSQGPNLTHRGMASGLLALALLWNLPDFLLAGALSPRSTAETRALNKIDLLHLGGYLRALADIDSPEPEPISLDRLKPSLEQLASMEGWLRWSKDVCAAAGGQAVLLFSSRPVCAPDPSYYWIRLNWVRWTQLPIPDLNADIRNTKPVIIEKICPPFQHCSMQPIDPHGGEYVDAGWAWVRQDLARRLSP
jgi:hypothetical protein